jgi:cellulose biosynthesis protein BcsQ
MVDILLISPDILTDSLPKEKFRCIMLLSTGRVDEKLNKYAAIDKYQTGEAVVGTILGIYSEQSTDTLTLPGEDKKTRVIGIYSPQGGSGKTSISLGCAIQCTDRGQKIFYLNLENIHSTQLFLESKSEKNLSHIFYYLKENISNLDMKIESVKQVDRETRIHFFLPPESALEYEELTIEDFQRLINHLRQMAVYDAVFVDMSSAFDSRNIAILEACDQVLVVLAHEAAALVKAERLSKEIDIAFRKFGIDLREKLFFVLNKYNPEVELDIDNISWVEKKAAVRIPLEPSLLVCDEGKCIINQNNDFGEGISVVLKKIFKDELKYE